MVFHGWRRVLREAQNRRVRLYISSGVLWIGEEDAARDGKEGILSFADRMGMSIRAAAAN
jgi:hypothetical protein